MIKINELRQGNIFLQDGVVIKFDFANISNTSEGDKLIFINLLTFEPIPLTDIWLKEHGFENEVGSMEWIHNSESDITFIIEYFEYTKAWHYTAGQGTRNGKGCKFVHELQNLIFSFTGEELIILE